VEGLGIEGLGVPAFGTAAFSMSVFVRLATGVAVALSCSERGRFESG
jgi:hypothetical protein